MTATGTATALDRLVRHHSSAHAVTVQLAGAARGMGRSLATDSTARDYPPVGGSQKNGPGSRRSSSTNLTASTAPRSTSPATGPPRKTWSRT